MSLKTRPTFTIAWSYSEQTYVAKCDTRPFLDGRQLDPEDALADLVWALQESERRT
jgi:hypothetical protein